MSGLFRPPHDEECPECRERYFKKWEPAWLGWAVFAVLLVAAVGFVIGWWIEGWLR